ncbi:MAG: der [Gammaproteobacteria bacterium]|jgi:GTP-binding protein|nr:der [Gammaproteobacteria bacterium]
MLPVVALVGRPNVGKSTLFNCLTQSRQALVADFPGLTRDRIYGESFIDDKRYILIDTGGIEENPFQTDNPMAHQAKLALEEADLILFITDARAGLLSADLTLAQHLRKLKKPVLCVVNKIDGLDETTAMSDFYRLGFSDLLPIAASHHRGIKTLITQLGAQLPFQEAVSEEIPDGDTEKSIKIAIVGRPNVGKSTLVNRLLGEERVVVLNSPGTTRDSIYIPCQYRNDAFTLIDTAGVRQRHRVTETVEKFSIIKTLQAIEDANVVICVLDATENITEQDLRLLGFILESGRALVIAVNKWDGLTSDQRRLIHQEIDRRLPFVSYAKIHLISALHGTGVGDLLAFAKDAYRSAMKSVPTHKLSALLKEAVTQHQPPIVKVHRIKLRYAHMGGHNPPIIVIHGTQTQHLPGSYQTYLANFFRKHLKLIGTPIRFQFRNSENPFAGRKPTRSAKKK